MNTIEIVFSIYGMISIALVLVVLIKIDADNKRIKKRMLKEAKHGEWQEVKRWECTTHSVTNMKCSVCHHYAEQVLPHQTTCTWDFCPNCGADMREWKKTNFLRKQKEKNMKGKETERKKR